MAEYFTEKAGNPYGVMSIDFSKSGSILFAGMDTGNVIGWDVPAGTEVGESVILTNKAGYTAQDAPIGLVNVLFTFENNTGRTYGRTDGRTDRRTDGRTDGRTRPHIEMRRRI